MSGAPIFAPWFANEQETHYSVHASDPDAAPMGDLVCKLPLTEQGLARARLIAAAPDGLDAAQLALKASLAAYGEPVEGASMQSAEGVAAIRALRDFIAKAEGRS